MKSKRDVCLLSWFTLSSLLLLHQTATAEQVSLCACEGNKFELKCNLKVPDSTNNFVSKRIHFIVGNNDSLLSDTFINTHAINVGGIDLTRLKAISDIGNSNIKNVLGSISLDSYTNSDAGKRLGCGQEFYLSGSSGNQSLVRKIALLKTAGTPTDLSFKRYIVHFNASNCEAIVNFSLSSDSCLSKTTYSLNVSGTSIFSDRSSSKSEYSYSTTLLPYANYKYTMVAKNCANKTSSKRQDEMFKGYRIDAPQLTYNEVSNKFTIGWLISTDDDNQKIPLLIKYSLKYNYTHTQGDHRISRNQSTDFCRINDVHTFSQPIPPPNFSANLEIETNIKACWKIIQQCIQSYTARPEICHTTNTKYILPPTSTTSVPTSTSTPALTPTPTPTTTSLSPQESNNAILIGGVVGGIAGLFLLLTVFVLILVVCHKVMDGVKFKGYEIQLLISSSKKSRVRKSNIWGRNLWGSETNRLVD